VIVQTRQCSWVLQMISGHEAHYSLQLRHLIEHMTQGHSWLKNWQSRSGIDRDVYEWRLRIIYKNIWKENETKLSLVCEACGHKHWCNTPITASSSSGQRSCCQCHTEFGMINNRRDWCRTCGNGLCANCISSSDNATKRCRQCLTLHSSTPLMVQSYK
jgi:hypothetical protein